MRISAVILELRLGQDFDSSPSLVGIVRPRFNPSSHGKGSPVTAGGALCIPLLTKDD